MSQRVVVTGMGVITPLGPDVPSMWQALLAGRSGVDRITLFDPEGFETQIAAEVKGFDPLQYLDRKEARHTDRFIQFAIAASLQAAEMAGLKNNGWNAEEVGVIIGSGIGGITTLSEQFSVLHQKGPLRISPFLVPMMITNMASGRVSIMLGAKGPNYCTTSACASGADAIGDAFEIVRRGEAQMMLAGGAEAAITPIGVAGFGSAGALSTRNHDPQRASRPFDRERDGFVMGEGSAIVVLENLEHALRRGAPILAEMVGYGATADAHHITQPSAGGEGGARAMRLALRKAHLEPAQIDYINAHGSSTPLNDKLESQAIKSVFGAEAYRIPVSSTKSMTGHLMGTAGAAEAIICVLAIQHGKIHPTINLENPDPECDLDYVPGEGRTVKIDAALSNSFGFGGHNACLVFKRYEE